MAVPGRRNGMLEDDDNDVEDGIFDTVDADDDVDTPPHLRDLVAAARSGDLAALRLALDDLDGDVDEPVEDGDTALHLTCLYGHLPCAQLLLERGASLEAKDEDGAIPLHDACAGGYTEIVQLLITRATDPGCARRMLDTVDVEGDTPLHHAARGEHLDTIRLLLSHGASLTTKNSYDKTPCELADPESDARAFLEAETNAIGH
ncbi:hypothetical protein KSS87_015917 [Heliosperma pusillum]|nr:hypothetical protein KSS87_015917 [Heliosperma pusillum]